MADIVRGCGSSCIDLDLRGCKPEYTTDERRLKALIVSIVKKYKLGLRHVFVDRFEIDRKTWRVFIISHVKRVWRIVCGRKNTVGLSILATLEDSSIFAETWPEDSRSEICPRDSLVVRIHFCNHSQDRSQDVRRAAEDFIAAVWSPGMDIEQTVRHGLVP